MPSLNISGIDVDFPFTPYDCQLAFMEQVIKALKNDKNALLESPTGTGKTLCLLCASLAWLTTARAQQEYLMQVDAADADAMASQFTSSTGLSSGLHTRPPRIIYASRTHTQLSQVMTELKRTCYSGFRTAIIASRDQLCIHPTVSNEPTNQAKQAACRVKVQTRTCHFYNNVEKKKDLTCFKSSENSNSNIMDIEDLKKVGNKHKCCPYYLTRQIAKEGADVVFMPYNYLLDPVIRKRHGVDLDGCVVIFDEAHNLGQVAEDSSSIDLSAVEITSCLEEVDEVCHFLENYGKDALEGDNFSSPENDDNINFELLTPENLMKVKAVLLDLEKEISNIELNKANEFQAGGDFLFDLLAKAKLRFDTYMAIYAVIDVTIAYLTSGGYSGIHNKAFGLNKIATFLRVVFESDSYNRDMSHDLRKAYISQYYKVYVHDQEQQNQKKTSKYWSTDSSSSKAVRIVSFWCFSPGFSMIDLMKQGVRSVILTSGTLKPLPSFSFELKLSFPVCLENPHVITSDQISVAVVKQGPESVTLNSNYQNRSDPRYHRSLGYAVMQIAKSVPNGMLVFFPSYYIMKIVIENWRSSHLMQCIERYKQVFVEPTNKQEFQLAMEQYYAAVNDATSNGAIFCGVCRGKVSEGLDFIDKNGRAVVITGIPYAPAKDPKVVMKKTYLDEQARSAADSLTGNQWYSQQASRAVNQAIGRVIRHRFDYGAILLLDTRFANPKTRSELPTWVQSEVVVHESFSSVIRMLNGFFSTVPGEIERKKAAFSNPVEPSGEPKLSLNTYALEKSSQKERTGGSLTGGSGLKAKVIYTDKTLVQSTNDSKIRNDLLTVSQPARKKIKMQMVNNPLAEKPSDSTPITCMADSTNHPTSGADVKNPKLQAATDALAQCKQLLSREQYVEIKKSLLLLYANKNVRHLEACVNILVRKGDTECLLENFKEVLNPKLRKEFDALVTEAKSKIGAEIVVRSCKSPIRSNEAPDKETSAHLKKDGIVSLIASCKSALTPEQNFTVKRALTAYKNKGPVEEFFDALKVLASNETSRPLLWEFRGAVRKNDVDKFIKLHEELAKTFKLDESSGSDPANPNLIYCPPVLQEPETTSPNCSLDVKDVDAAVTSSTPIHVVSTPPSDGLF